MQNVNQLTKRFLDWDKLTKKEENYLWKKLVAKADEVFSKWIRYRDKDKWCITKWNSWCKNIIQHNCHWIWRAYYSHRRDEDNCAWWCASCNTYHQEEHKVLFTAYQYKTHWEKRVEHELKIRNKIKPTIKELLEIIDLYTKKLEWAFIENTRNPMKKKTQTTKN